MSSVTCIADVTVQALEDLLSQFDDSPNTRALVALLSRSWQSLEDDACTLIFDALLSNATGALLDRYGLIVGVPRDGRTDDAYRALIEVTISSRDTSGTIESIITVVSTLAGGFNVQYSPLPVAAYTLAVAVPGPGPMPTETVDDIAAQLELLSPAGVGFSATQVPPDPFAFAGPDGLGFDAGAFAGAII